MSINGIGSYRTQNYVIQNPNCSAGRNSFISDDALIGNATSLSESSDNGKKIGVAAVGNIAYIAMYADSSTEQDPIVKVGDYEVRIKDVNPNNATQMEMFALMSYMDDKGLTNNQGMSSFSKLTAYASQAEYNGYCNGISDENAAWTVERDWIGILKNAKETFFSNSLMYEQGLECEKLIENLGKWSDTSVHADINAMDNIQKKFRSGFFEGAETEGRMLEKPEEDYLTLIRQQIEKMQEKIDSGEINETFQIGAKAFTLEEWKDFLDKFDSIQEIIRELMRERHEKLEKEQIEKKMASKEEMVTEILFSEHTSSTHFSADSKEEIRYITWYTEEGIFCRKAGQTEGYEWSVSFDYQKQYDKVREFVRQLSNDDDLRFTAEKNFWRDFLKSDKL